jgi:hypothetical protein
MFFKFAYLQYIQKYKAMVLYYDPLTKMGSMERRKPGKDLHGKMATIFWGCRGILLVGFKERNTGVNALYYAFIFHILHGAIRRKEEYWAMEFICSTTMLQCIRQL